MGLELNWRPVLLIEAGPSRFPLLFPSLSPLLPPPPLPPRARALLFGVCARRWWRLAAWQQPGLVNMMSMCEYHLSSYTVIELFLFLFVSFFILLSFFLF
jgi:hypothetical protein